jgi:hypothetical protein
VRNFILLGILPVLALVTGCAQAVSGDTEEILVETSPKSAAQCTLQNGRGSWGVLSTPAKVTILRSTTPLSVNCRTGEGWSGSATIPSSVGILAYADAVTVVGAAVETQTGAAYEYPDRLNIPMQAPADARNQRGQFGADGGRFIAPPPETLADRARQNDDNIATRFQTLRVLLDNGLITAEEYNTRRGANLGALLRYSVTPPARDLERAPPQPQALVARLRYLAGAYAEHSITAGEQAAERAVILDGLMPAQSVRRADPPPPIKDQLRLAAEIGRIERLLTAHVITDKEAAGERAKVTGLLDSAVASEEAAARAAMGAAVTLAPVPAPASGVGIALSTHSSETQARRIWAGLQKVYPAELGKLKLALKKVPRPHRPSYWRITAGPVADYATATALCKTLSKQGVACEAASFGE